MATKQDFSDEKIYILGGGIGEKYCAKFNANCEHFAASGLCKYTKNCVDQRKAKNEEEVSEKYRLAMRRDQLQILKLLQEMREKII